jgi:hypothetical protein
VLVENRDNTTANAIKTPQRHFSHNIRPHVVASPALEFSSGFVIDLSAALAGPADADDAADAGEEDEGVASSNFNDADGRGGAVNVRGSVFPRSFCPMLGRSWRWGVQNWKYNEISDGSRIEDCDYVGKVRIRSTWRLYAYIYRTDCGTMEGTGEILGHSRQGRRL